MPVTGTPVAAPSSTRVVTADALRMFLRDYSGKNPLLDDVEFTDSELDVAVERAVDFANIVDRPTGWEPTTFPNKTLLLMGAASYLLMSESFRQMRNQANYQDGNIQGVGIDNKQQEYGTMSAALRQEFRASISQIKIAENMGATGFYRSVLSRRRY